MTSKRISDVIAIAFLVGVPLLLSTESTTRQILQHPLGLFLLVPLGVILVNRIYPRATLSNGLVVFQIGFFGLWGLICGSVLLTRTTEHGLDVLFVPMFKAMGASFRDATIMGMFTFLSLFVLSLIFIVGMLLYAVLCRLRKSEKTD